MRKYLYHGSRQTLKSGFTSPHSRPGESAYQHASAFGVFGAELIDTHPAETWPGHREAVTGRGGGSRGAESKRCRLQGRLQLGRRTLSVNLPGQPHFAHIGPPISRSAATPGHTPTFDLQRWSGGEPGGPGDSQGGVQRRRKENPLGLQELRVGVPPWSQPQRARTCTAILWALQPFVSASVGANRVWVWPHSKLQAPGGWFLPWPTPCPLAWAELGGKLVNKREGTNQGVGGLSRGLPRGSGSNPSSATYCSVCLWLRPSLSLVPSTRTCA